jgi:hypothetical protein
MGHEYNEKNVLCPPHHSSCVVPYWELVNGEILSEFLFFKFKKWNDFGEFQLLKVWGKKGEKKSKNCQISIFGFQCVAMNIKK